jgi:hypothetical protein
MSDTQKELQVKAPVVVRNKGTKDEIGKALTLTSWGKTSPNKGKEFWCPDVTIEDWEEWVKWFGIENIIGPLRRSARAIFGDISLDKTVLNDDGTVNEVAIMAMWEDFTSGGAKKGEIEDELDSLQETQAKYVLDNDDYGATNPDGTPTEAAVKLNELITNLNKKVRSLKKQLAEINERSDKRVAARKAKESAQVAEPAVA